MGALDEDAFVRLSSSVTVVICGLPPPPPPEDCCDTVIVLDTELNVNGAFAPRSVAIELYVNVPVLEVTNEMEFVPPGEFIMTFDPNWLFEVSLKSSIVNGPMPFDSSIVNVSVPPCVMELELGDIEICGAE